MLKQVRCALSHLGGGHRDVSSVKRRLGKVVEEAGAVRGRLPHGDWQLAASYAELRVRSLESFIGTPSGEELHRHVIVSAIAALQTFHRATLIDVINHSEAYKARAVTLIDEKFSLSEALALVGEERFSVGELIAHSAPCNGVEDLVSWMSRLLDQDIKRALATAADPLDRHMEAGASAPLVEDVEGLFRDLERTFHLRHVLAHEAVPFMEVSIEEARSALRAVKLWMVAIEAILWATVFKDEPLTQMEMTGKAMSEVSAARPLLAKAMWRALRCATDEGTRPRLRANHRDWKAAARGWVDFAYWSRDGSMWPAIGGSEYARELTARAKRVNEWVDSHEP